MGWVTRASDDPLSLTQPHLADTRNEPHKAWQTASEAQGRPRKGAPADPPPFARPLADRPHPLRTQTCPSLLRVFVRTGQHHADTDFTNQHVPSADEHQLYTW